MDLDRNAPLIARKEIIINASIAHVWRLQADIEAWPTWQKDISSAVLEGPLQQGAVFKWKAMGMKIVSTLEEVVPEKVICWSGVSFGMSAVHRWVFEDRGEKTLVITEESLSGWFPKIIRLFQPQFLDTSLEKALKKLKDRAESR